jgi:hypothetical protein
MIKGYRKAGESKEGAFSCEYGEIAKKGLFRGGIAGKGRKSGKSKFANVIWRKRGFRPSAPTVSSGTGATTFSFEPDFVDFISQNSFYRLRRWENYNLLRS